MVRRLLYILMVWVAGIASASTAQGILHPAFRSLQVRVNGNQICTPVIALNTSDQIEIVFDELADDRRYMRYELIHCDRHWKPEALVDSEFLNGFNVADVDDYEFSRATLVHYVNYRITLPNEQMQMKVSGNYLVRVYDQDDPDTTLLQARFMVSESTMTVDGGVTARTDIDTNAAHQQVELTVDTRNAGVESIYDDLGVVVTLNGNPASSVTVNHPLRVSGTRAVYEHLRPLIFEAGNEYRRFETVSTRYPGIGIANIEYIDPIYNFTLATDEPRAEERYVYDQTQHGRFYIREYDSADSDTEADYAMVHFSLQMPRLQGREVYVDGDMTSHRLDNTTRMTYNPDSGCYELSMLLKQGAYNYQYVTARESSAKAEAATIEGNRHETSNEYLVSVYHRPRGSRYDRLTAVGLIHSNQ